MDTTTNLTDTALAAVRAQVKERNAQVKVVMDAYVSNHPNMALYQPHIVPLDADNYIELTRTPDGYQYAGYGPLFAPPELTVPAPNPPPVPTPPPPPPEEHIYLDATNQLGRAIWETAVAYLGLEIGKSHASEAWVDGVWMLLWRFEYGVKAATVNEDVKRHYSVKPPEEYLLHHHLRHYDGKTTEQVWTEYETGTAEPPTCSRSLDEVQMEAIRWLWPGYLPCGMLTALDGDPGMGKSFITVDWAARLSKGMAMPNGHVPKEPVNVLLVNMEDSAKYTIKARFLAAGGDPTRVRVLEDVPVRPYAKKRRKPKWESALAPEHDDDEPAQSQTVLAPFQLPRDLPLLRHEIERWNIKLAVIDPLMGGLGKEADSSRDQDVRTVVMSPLKQLADETDCCILVVRHLTKGSMGGPVIYRGSGAMGIIGAVRLALMAQRDPEDEHAGILGMPKINIAKMAPSLKYTVVDAGEGVAKVEWRGPSEYTAEEVNRKLNEHRTEQTRLNDLSLDILDVVRTSNKFALSPDEVVARLTKKHGGEESNADTVHRTLNRLVKRGSLTKVGHARYCRAEFAGDEEMPVR